MNQHPLAMEANHQQCPNDTINLEYLQQYQQCFKIDERQIVLEDAATEGSVFLYKSADNYIKYDTSLGGKA